MQLESSEAEQLVALHQASIDQGQHLNAKQFNTQDWQLPHTGEYHGYQRFFATNGWMVIFTFSHNRHDEDTVYCRVQDKEGQLLDTKNPFISFFVLAVFEDLISVLEERLYEDRSKEELLEVEDSWIPIALQVA